MNRMKIRHIINTAIKNNEDITVTDDILNYLKDEVAKKVGANRCFRLDSETRDIIGSWSAIAIYVIDDNSSDPRVLISLSDFNYGHQMLYTYLNGYPDNNVFDLRNGIKYEYNLAIPTRINSSLFYDVDKSTYDYFKNVAKSHMEKLLPLLESTDLILGGYNLYDSYKGIVSCSEFASDRRYSFYSDFQDKWRNRAISTFINNATIESDKFREYAKTHAKELIAFCNDTSDATYQSLEEMIGMK